MIRFIFSIAWLFAAANSLTAELWPGFVDAGYHNEQVREICFADEARAIVVAPTADDFNLSNRTLLVVYATPNGNTAEQTLGCQLSEGMDWHFDIQHAEAQWRVFRSFEKERNVVLACVQANNLSWPTWKGQRPHGPRYIREIVESLAANLPSAQVDVILTGHSGGGSFIFGFIDAYETMPKYVERIAFLDANYGYDTSSGHGNKIIQWLEEDPKRHFVVLAYDDRNIELDGKKVVGPTGGTFRATQRMLDYLKEKLPVEADKSGDFDRNTTLNGRLVTLVHPNPDNLILHTRLVGEMNGLLEGLTLGTPYHDKWGNLATPRAYSALVQPQPLPCEKWITNTPAIPNRCHGMSTGSAVVSLLVSASPTDREQVIAKEILSGNIPTSWRQFAEVTASCKTTDETVHKIVYCVAPDYLSVGNDRDFVRMPLTPYVAQQIADVMGCVLPTRKMVDDIHQAAALKLAPQPLTKDRELLATFSENNRIIQEQWANRIPGQFVSGIKKDVVLTNKLTERPDRVAIYGWHQLDGQPIQPLSTVHIDWYVDYSHGIRLVSQWAEVDGRPMRIQDVLRDEELCGLLSDEGPLEITGYRRGQSK